MAGSMRPAPTKPLDHAIDALHTLGLVKVLPDDAPVIALVERISGLDADASAAIARPLAQATVFNGVVRGQAGVLAMAERYRALGLAFDSIREDANTMVRQVADGRIDTLERLANIWMKATRGDIPERFARIRLDFLDVARDAQDQIDREQIILNAYREFRSTLKDAQHRAADVLSAAGAALDAAKAALQDAAAAIDADDGTARELAARLLLDRDLRLRALQDEDRRYQVAKDLAGNLAIAANNADLVMARLQQLADCNERAHSQATTFFGTNETVFSALSASFTGLHGLHDAGQPALPGAGPGVAPVSVAGANGSAERDLHLGRGPSLRTESVRKLVEALVGFQRKSREVADEMRSLVAGNDAEMRQAIDDGQRRMVALALAAASLPGV